MSAAFSRGISLRMGMAQFAGMTTSDAYVAGP